MASTSTVSSMGVSADLRRVAFVGLGEMGLPMATRLLQAGFSVVGVDVRAARSDMFVAAGGTAADSPRLAAEAADAVVLIPFDGEQLEATLLGAGGALTALAGGSTVLAMATVGPRAMHDIAKQVASRGEFNLVDAPVTGGSARASAGELTAIAAGTTAAMARARPLLEAMCSNIFHVGTEPGAAQVVKLINQLLVGTHLAASAEAFALAAAAGVDATQLYEVLTSGFARSEVLVSRVAAVLDGSLRTGGAMGIYLKDLPLVLDMGRELKVPLFTGGSAFNLVQLAAELGHADEDDAALIALLMQLAARASRGPEVMQGVDDGSAPLMPSWVPL
jgi:3-hydroxyisobutyrate dehydrogenase-like beta-hydroxyacid dehydrogenase